MKITQKMRWTAGLVALGIMFAVTAVACGGTAADAPKAAAEPAAPAAAAAPAAPEKGAAAEAPAAAAAAKKGAAAAAPEAAAAAKKGAAAEAPATATAAPKSSSSAAAPAAVTGGPSGTITRAFSRLEAVYGVAYTGPYRSSATDQIGGLSEMLFRFEKGDPMHPMLISEWNIDPAGTRAQMTLREGLKWQNPKGHEDKDFGSLDAAELVEWFNRANATTNPDTTYGDAGDFAAIFLEAKALDDLTIEIGLVQPVFFCLPVSQFGCLSAARGPAKWTHVDEYGYEWAKDKHIGTGPYVQGECVPGDRCTMHAVSEHWRIIPDVAEIIGIQVPEAQTQIAMLRTGEIDLASVDYKLLTETIEGEGNLQWIETMPGGYVGQAILFPGNLWEHSHARTAEDLNPWDAAPYAIDYPWLGNPWGTQDAACPDATTAGYEKCGVAPYTDTDNPEGMSDMEQARLVRIALSTAIDRGAINDVLLDGIGTPIYSEYMGPEYPGWDAAKTTDCYDWLGNVVTCEGTMESLKWQLPDADLDAAGALLDAAGFPKNDSGDRDTFYKLTLQAYPAEAGPVGLEVADIIMSDWARLGIEIDGLVEDYGGVISPRMRQRIQYLPVLKNGDVHSNVYPLDWPLPTVDTSSSRPGWGVGFESQAGANWLPQILGEKDKTVREGLHTTWVDWSMFWVQYAGVFQVPKGIVASSRIKCWQGYQQHYSNISGNPEFIVLEGSDTSCDRK